MDKKKDHYYDEIIKALEHIKTHKYDPKAIQKEYYSKYGFYRSARRLAKIVNELEGSYKFRYCFYKGFQYLIKRWKDWEAKNK